jgi:hypothetical protein
MYLNTRRTGPYMMVPAQLEQALTIDAKKAELMVYPLSPSIHFPTTYMMLDADHRKGKGPINERATSIVQQFQQSSGFDHDDDDMRKTDELYM